MDGFNTFEKQDKVLLGLNLSLIHIYTPPAAPPV